MAPPRTLLVGRRLGSRSLKGAVARDAWCARGACMPARPDCCLALGPPRSRSGVQRKAVPRSLLAFSGFAVPKGLLRTWCPSCESSSSASSRGATPAMALLRFSAPGAWVRRLRRRRELRWDRRPHPPSACHGLAARPWSRGRPRRRSRAPPFRVFPPSEVGCRFARPWPSWGSPRRVPAAAAEPLQGFDPWTECLAVLVEPLLPLLGFSPLGRSPPAPWCPVWPGLFLLRASPPVPVGRRRRHPGVLRCAGSGVAVSGAGPSGVCDP